MISAEPNVDEYDWLLDGRLSAVLVDGATKPTLGINTWSSGVE